MRTTFNTLFCFFGLLEVSMAACPSGLKWNYEGTYYWPKQCDACAGDRQSPIDIHIANVFDEDFIGPIRFVGYETPIPGNLENDGHVLKFNPDSIGDYKLVHPQFAKDYILAQFHFHWGSTNDQGSEHTIDGVAYPMELHLVHYNSKYADLATAVNSGDDKALAVVGIMFHIGEIANSALESIVDQLNDQDDGVGNYDLDTPNDMEPVTVDLEKIIAQVGCSYYNYRGSLTTPTCNQQVIWLVMEETVSINQEQMDAFRKYINFKSGAPMVDNYRPTQPINNRIIRRFEKKCQCKHPEALCGLDGNCYVIVENSDEELFNLRYSHSVCRNKGMILPEIRTYCESNQLKGLLPENIEKFYLGFGDWKTEGTFKYFSDSTEITFKDWLSGQPNDPMPNGPQECVAMWTSSGAKVWNDVDCTWKMDAIVCMEKPLAPCECFNDNSICAEDGTCYLVAQSAGSASIDRDTAAGVCTALKMDLPELRNELQWYTFSTLMYDLGVADVWLGSEDDNGNNDYNFLSNGDKQEFFNWADASTNLVDTASCILSDTTLGGWSDQLCTAAAAKHVVCQEKARN